MAVDKRRFGLRDNGVGEGSGFRCSETRIRRCHRKEEEGAYDVRGAQRSDQIQMPYMSRKRKIRSRRGRDKPSVVSEVGMLSEGSDTVSIKGIEV
jgi:hypothetical protein